MPHTCRSALRGLAMSLVLLAATMSSGCGYSLAGRGSFLPSYIRTIGVPMFINNTPVFDVERTITDRVRSELIGRGRYKVETERVGVDAVLTGEILNIALARVRVQPAAAGDPLRHHHRRQDRVPRRQDRQGAVAEPGDGVHRAVRRDDRPSLADAAAFLGQNTNAVERLASEFARTVVSAILEAF